MANATATAPVRLVLGHATTTSPVRLVLEMAAGIWSAYWAVLLPLLLIGRLLHKRYASPLRHYPGPLLASVTRLWKTLSVATTQTHLHHIALHKKYGSVVRIAPNEISLASPEAARLVLSAGKHFAKTKFYGVFPPPENTDIFTEIREDVHAQKKKVINVSYSMAAMQKLSPLIDDSIELFMSKMAAIADGQAADGQAADARGPTVDLGAWLHYFAFDVLGEVAFGRSFGFLAQGRDVENAILTIDNSQRYNGIVGQLPELDLLLRRNPLRKLIPALDSKNSLITRMALEEMGRRRPFVKDDRQDLLASLIKGHLKDTDKFGEGDVFATAHGAIFAGSDSTASTMQSFFWHILHDTRVYARIVVEMEDAVASGTVPASGNISWAQAQSLTYLQACIKEGMRMRPAVGLNMSRIVPPEGIELDGQFFPGGTELSVNGWVLHRDTATFGEDADTYRPERWTEDEERARRMERYMFHFGGGAHLCIGRNLALLEINKVLPRLLRDFRLSLVHPDRPLTAHATFFVVQSGLEVFIQKRV